MTLLNERSKSGTDEDNDEAHAVVPECDRSNCKDASAPLFTQIGLQKPICVQYFNEVKAKLAGIKAMFVPGYTNWARMIQGWVVDNPRPISTPCWSRAATLEGSTAAGNRHWCEVLRY